MKKPNKIPEAPVIGSPLDLKQPMSVHIMDYSMNLQQTPGHPMTALPCPPPIMDL